MTLKEPYEKEGIWVWLYVWLGSKEI